MKKILLISEATIKDQSIIEVNADPKLLSKIVVAVQELQLKNILGDTLYTSLMDDVYQKSQDSSFALSDVHQDLLKNYIQPFLVHAVVTEFIVVNNYKVSNKGILKMTDDSASNVGADELEVIRAYSKNYAAEYKERLIQFLRKNNLVENFVLQDTDTVSDSVGWFLEPMWYDYLQNGRFFGEYAYNNYGYLTSYPL